MPPTLLRRVLWQDLRAGTLSTTVRIEAAAALNEMCRLLDRDHLPQDAIEQATNAVIAWLEAPVPEIDRETELSVRAEKRNPAI